MCASVTVYSQMFPRETGSGPLASRWKDQQAVVMGNRKIGISSDGHSVAPAATADLSSSLHLIQNTGYWRWGLASHPAGRGRLDTTDRREEFAALRKELCYIDIDL